MPIRYKNGNKSGAIRRRDGGSVLIGTAGWSIPRALSETFSSEGSHLKRYARVMTCTEINTSFYRNHSRDTYEKWAALTPAAFRFSVKIPSLITHELLLRRARLPLRMFLCEMSGLGNKLGPLLLQLPPSLAFTSRQAHAFFGMLREEYEGVVVCEPRHMSWFGPKSQTIWNRYHIGRVATDPTRIDAARAPGGWMGSGSRNPDAVAYYRLHGSPRKYWSRYELPRIRQWAEEIAQLSRAAPVWCIFDNTASGAALANALEMKDALSDG